MSKNEMNEIAKRIFSRKDHDYAAATYKDVDDLKKLYELAKQLPIENKKDFRFVFDALVFIAEQYETMGRMSVAAKYRLEALLFVEGFADEYQDDEEFKDKVVDLFTLLLRDRNYFVDDDCEDCLKAAKATKLMGEEEIKKIHQQRMNRRRNLKSDPVEMSEEYLAVIDEVERKIDANMKNKGGMGSCFEFWSLKQEYLAEKGINWTSPALLNPRVMFD